MEESKFLTLKITFGDCLHCKHARVTNNYPHAPNDFECAREADIPDGEGFDKGNCPCWELAASFCKIHKRWNCCGECSDCMEEGWGPDIEDDCNNIDYLKDV